MYKHIFIYFSDFPSRTPCYRFGMEQTIRIAEVFEILCRRTQAKVIPSHNKIEHFYKIKVKSITFVFMYLYIYLYSMKS